LEFFGFEIILHIKRGQIKYDIKMPRVKSQVQTFSSFIYK
jgi:hypothetical protein